MRILRQQAGMTPVATIAIIVLVACVAFLALKLVPVYLEYFSVVSSVNSLQEDPDLGQKSQAAVQELLKRRLEINDVTRVRPDNVKITRSGSETVVEVKYEARVPLVGNVDLIASFEKRAEFR